MSTSILPLLFFLMAQSVGLPDPSAMKGWSDEFDRPAIDTNLWSFEEGFIRNHEGQYYTNRPENAYIKDGCLVLEARREPFPNARHNPDSDRWQEQWGTAEYTSASLHTAGKREFLYGRMEVRAKLPAGRGVWPAIWTLGNKMGEDIPWPDRGEIDIMEFVGYNPGMIYANVHTGAYNWVAGTNKGDSIQIGDASTAFHVYAIDWTPERIDFYVDSTRYFSFERDAGAGFQRWPFDRPQALKLNLAIGGNWGGRQGIDTTIFPQRYYIDYVRYTPFSP